MARAEDIFERIIKKGETAIDAFLLTRESESLFLDFKRSADDGSGNALHNNDRNNLAKAISGFGNSEGGVVVWGIDCSKLTRGSADVARAKSSIYEVKRFISWLEGAVSGCTVPPHKGVQNECLLTDPSGSGFALSLIPKSADAPHQVVGRLQYYIRAGSSFMPVPHAVLAGMFGRRPQPRLIPKLVVGDVHTDRQTVTTQIGFLIRNHGPGIARDVFASAMVMSMPGPECALSFEPADSSYWHSQWSFGRHMSTIAKPEFRLPPESHVQPFVLNLTLAPPFTEDLEIEVCCGCAESPLVKPTIRQTAREVLGAHNKFLATLREGRATKEDERQLLECVFKTDGYELA